MNPLFDRISRPFRPSETPKSKPAWVSLELCLLLGCLVALLVGTASYAQNQLSDKLVRLHVIAASDSDEDQALKLRVRDEVLAFLSLETAQTRAEAEAAITADIPALQTHLEAFLAAEGAAQTVSVALEEHAFPSRDYGTFALPAGTYHALRVILGPGEGRNWWCVVFPPLCAASATENIETIAEDAGLSQEDIDLMTQNGEGYVIKFKIAEWFGKVLNR